MKNISPKTLPTQYKRAAIIVSSLLSVQVTFHFVKDVRFLFVILPVFVLLYFFCHLEYFDNSKEISISTRQKSNGIFRCWLICFLIILSGQMFFWGAFFPGGFNLDSLNQWYQIHNELPVSNWHSPLVTFIYWLITRLSDTLAACIVVQITLFSFAAALLISELYRQYISQSMSVVVAALIALNPAIGRINISLVKDVYFSIIALLMYFFLLKIIGSAGRSLHSKSTIAFSSLLLTAMVLVRHNGIFLAATLLLGLFLCYREYRACLRKIALLSVLLVFFVEGPIYRVLNVAPHANIVGESVGAPMAIMVNALVNDPDNIPDDVSEFLHSIEPDDSVWKEQYSVGEWDSCKWTIGENADEGMLLADESLIKIIHLTAETIIACPNASYQSLRENTRIFWQSIGTCNWLPYVFQEGNPYQITYHSIGILGFIETKFFSFFSDGPLCIYHWNTGLQVTVLLLLFLRCVKHGFAKKGLLIFPLVAYNTCTALIIAGPNYRYFYCNAVLFIPLMLYMFCETPDQ